MVRAVLDTVMFVRCLLDARSRWGSLVFDHRDRYRLIVSQPVLDEILEVLDRPVLSKKFRFVSGRDKQTVLAFLANAEIARVDETRRHRATRRTTSSWPRRERPAPTSSSARTRICSCSARTMGRGSSTRRRSSAHWTVRRPRPLSAKASRPADAGWPFESRSIIRITAPRSIGGDDDGRRRCRSGMEEGGNDAMERLDELLARLTPGG